MLFSPPQGHIDRHYFQNFFEPVPPDLEGLLLVQGEATQVAVQLGEEGVVCG